MSIEGKEKYRQWLKTSFRWETARLEALGWDKMKCYGCEKIDKKNHAHHIFYPETWNDTTRRHLRSLCNECHKRIHELTTPNLYKTKREARRKFMYGINVIRKLNNLSALKDPNQTPSGEIRKKEFLSKRTNKLPSLNPIIGDELGILDYELGSFHAPF